MRLELWLLMLSFVLVLGYMHRHHRQHIKAQRGAMFQRCLDRFDGYRILQDDVNFPVLSGHYRGYRVSVEPLADHVGYRKLPSLWLLVTIREAVPFQGSFDLLARPQNIEFFSPADHLPEALALPQGWPEHATLRSDAPAQMPPQQVLAPHIAMFDDPRTKELLITPHGVRIVYQANQAQRRHYTVLRGVVFENLALEPALVHGLLDRAIALYEDLIKETADEDIFQP